MRSNAAKLALLKKLWKDRNGLNPNWPTVGISDTPSLLRIIEHKLPKNYTIDDNPAYVLRLSGVEVDVLHYVIDLCLKEVIK